ncbi:hypothetical protein V9T40_004603 [Parthenolecanium corni]|uniref:Uncharacterized protein n=1 Tax=Parthenolecanium corni TaxID=536013 RepID=A0AAN9TWV0_9HEMI
MARWSAALRRRFAGCGGGQLVGGSAACVDDVRRARNWRFAICNSQFARFAYALHVAARSFFAELRIATRR